jgi:hypothetical protein
MESKLAISYVVTVTVVSAVAASSTGMQRREAIEPISCTQKNGCSVIYPLTSLLFRQICPDNLQDLRTRQERPPTNEKICFFILLQWSFPFESFYFFAFRMRLVSIFAAARRISCKKIPIGHSILSASQIHSFAAPQRLPPPYEQWWVQ